MSAHARGPILASLAMLVLSACGGSPTAPAAPGPSSDVAARLSTLVNGHRVSLGCTRLVEHAGVAAVARAHSEDMARRGFFDHVNPDGESPFDRLREAGIVWRGGAAENIAVGRVPADEIFRAWLGSPGHRAAIETCEYTHHGIGVIDDRWTQLFVANPSS